MTRALSSRLSLGFGATIMRYPRWPTCALRTRPSEYDMVPRDSHSMRLEVGDRVRQ